MAMAILSIMNYIDFSFRAVCKAIDHFSTGCKNIFIPIKPFYSYDLIVLTKNDEMLRVKVARTESKAPSGSYVVNLRKSGGYDNSKETKAPFESSGCDIVCVISPENIYVIPSCEINQKRAISLSMFEEFKYIPS